MQTFLEEVISSLSRTNSTYENVAFILPSQRAKVFVKQVFRAKNHVGFLPKMYTIEELVAAISQLVKMESIPLLFEFYKVYKEQIIDADSFETFLNWAPTILQDFNEIDQYLVKPNEIFTYLKDIQRLRKWSVTEPIQTTELIKNHFDFLEQLLPLYTVLQEKLLSINTAYQGLMYRIAHQKTGNFLGKHPNFNFYFIGFNALNTAEESIIQQFLEYANTTIFWDIDSYFLEGNHISSKFIKKYKEQWHYYKNNSLQLIHTNFEKQKDIQVIGCPKNVTQIKYASQIINTTQQQKTAWILGDETLLPLVLNALPANVGHVNITMGYPLKDTAIAIFIKKWMAILINKEQNTNLKWHYKDVIYLLTNPLLANVLSTNQTKIEHFIKKITKQNLVYVDAQYIYQQIDTQNELITCVFHDFESIQQTIQNAINLITTLKNEVSTLEKEYLFKFYNIFLQLKELNNQHQFIQNLKTLQHFLQQLINSENLFFQGEPLQGLQLMGMLETRVIDFETIVLTSVNEGVIPKSSTTNSFIPFDVRLDFNLPTYREKDAIFSYHFFRLLQRAKTIYLLYNTENDEFGKGEMSRFINQLKLLKPTEINFKTVTPHQVLHAQKPIEIKKTATLTQKLIEISQKGFSPTSITTYLNNPYNFYKKYVLNINQLDEVEETVAQNTLGNVVHDTLYELYQPYIDVFLTTENIHQMQGQSDDLAIKYFKKYYADGDIKNGKNRLIFEVAKRYVTNFLAQEKKLVYEGNYLKIKCLEKKCYKKLKLTNDQDVMLYGLVDRIDELNGTTRIIDYKTGFVTKSNLKFADFEAIREEKYFKSIQLLVYAYILLDNEEVKLSFPIEAGIISFKNAKEGFIKLNTSATNVANYQINNEIVEAFSLKMKEILEEILDPEVPFIQNLDAKY